MCRYRELGGIKLGPKAPIRLIRHVWQSLSQFNLSKQRRMDGVSPSTPDTSLIEIAQSGIYAFGHQHVGLTAGAKTGRLI